MTRKRKSGGSDSLYYYKWLDKALSDSIGVKAAKRYLKTYAGE